MCNNSEPQYNISEPQYHFILRLSARAKYFKTTHVNNSQYLEELLVNLKHYSFLGGGGGGSMSSNFPWCSLFSIVLRKLPETPYNQKPYGFKEFYWNYHTYFYSFFLFLLLFISSDLSLSWTGHLLQALVSWRSFIWWRVAVFSVLWYILCLEGFSWLHELCSKAFTTWMYYIRCKTLVCNPIATVQD